MKKNHTVVRRMAVMLLAAAMLVSPVSQVAVRAAGTTESASKETTTKKGFVKEGTKTYYYQNNKKFTGQKKINGFWYFFDPAQKGAMATGIYHVVDKPKKQDKWCYYNKDGQMQYGEKKLKDGSNWYWFYFNKSTGEMARDKFVKLSTSNGKTKTCYYDSKGHMLYGQQKIKGYWYNFANTTGAMRTGWVDIKEQNKRVYYNSKGQMQYGVQTINGTKYEFNSKTGALQLGNPDINAKAQGYSSRTKYLVLINRGLRKVSIYQGQKGNWRCIKYWPCVVGAPSTPTPTGIFSTSYKGHPSQPYFESGGARWWYYTSIHGSILFHSQGYDYQNAPNRCVAPAMGVAVSHGCVRLYLENAKWIWSNLPTNTTVVVYN